MNKRKRLLKIVIRTVLISFSAALATLMLFETRLIYPAPDPLQAIWTPKDFVYEDVTLTAADGTSLHGWYLPHEDAKACLLYFHGNGEHVPWCADQMGQWRDRLGINVLLMDYRGYGKSGGKPTESALIADGVLAVKWLADRNQCTPADVVLWGRSIGGGVAAGVAETTNPKGIILETTFNSLTNVAQSKFWFLPVRWLMQNQYDSEDRLRKYQGNLIQWHGAADTLIPIAMGKALFDSVPTSSKQFFVSPRAGHNDEAPAMFNRAVTDWFKTNP